MGALAAQVRFFHAWVEHEQFAVRAVGDVQLDHVRALGERHFKGVQRVTRDVAAPHAPGAR